ncbi:twin-arginine translocase subunit TatC [Halorientalis salina]|uniref:twin-arginine translocase subunit TatC n=1 Tax=Halorientalis salina TaxID=2932266 RepID=UPI0010AC777A|nr:twin-arginine translocase subunit TatC [Halorientalis salina]
MSGAVDDDARESLQSGRETLGAMLSSAQSDLQKVFIVAVVGLMGTIYLLREFVWEMLKRDLFSMMPPFVREETSVVAITPFDVILLQVKIGLVVGLLLAIPLFIWYSRDALRQRGYWPGERVARWKFATVLLLSLVLLAAGVSYAYELFFPLMFNFLATNAVQVGFKPTYSIVKWAQFIFLLTVSFGLAAQLPLVMSALSYTGIVRYETFRDKWRYAVLGIFVFGALFSPPDPFTQVMWALPLILLYGISLQMAKFVTIAKRSSSRVDVGGVLRERWNVLAGVAFLSLVGVYAFFARGGIDLLNRALGRLPADYRVQVATLGEATGLPNETAAAVAAVLAALVVTGVVLFSLLMKALSEADRAFGGTAAPASAGSPTQIDVSELTAGAVRAAPPEVFHEMSEEESVALAREAMDDDNPEKAQAILDRFDDEQEAQEAEGEGDAAAAAGGAAAGAAAQGDGGEGGTAAGTAAGMMNAFTEDETTEEDIGGYYYDVAFILESLTSKAFRIVGLFMLVLGGSFVWLYQGGIRRIKDTFFGQMPAGLQPDVEIVTLHPVEALIFEIKFSTLLAAVVTVPLVLYYAWPALKERGLVRGDPRVMLVWGGSLILGVIGGSIVGFLYVAPTIISWLAADAVQSNMVIAYRINNFGWLVIYTTVGIGLLAEIPVSMALFHVGNVVSYHTMRSYWRQVVVVVFAVSALVSPRGVFTMLMLAVPATAAYLAGLFLLWVITLGGRRGRPEPAGTTAD